MPWTISNPPPPAKNWTTDQKRRCVAAANAVLRSGKSEQEAVFACIHAAGKTRKKQTPEEDYETEVEDGLGLFQDLVEAYLVGAITLAILRSRFRSAVEDHYTRIMLIALSGREPTERQLAELNRRIEQEMNFLDNFVADLESGTISADRAMWRASMYAPARGAFVYFSLPDAVADLMPGLPGDVCLGDGLCGCRLEYYQDDEGNIVVEWIVDQQKEHCAVCLEYESNSPYIFTPEMING